jgi:hypothetical protein
VQTSFHNFRVADLLLHLRKDFFVIGWFSGLEGERYRWITTGDWISGTTRSVGTLLSARIEEVKCPLPGTFAVVFSLSAALANAYFE